MAIHTITTEHLKQIPRGPQRIDYWGYGLEADPSVIEAIAGTFEGLYVVGGVKKAIAKDTQLVVQGIDLVPTGNSNLNPREVLTGNSNLNPREVLKTGWQHTNSTFESYSVVHAEGKSTEGTLYSVTNLAIIQALNEWDMVPEWRQRDVVKVEMADGFGKLTDEESNVLTYTARSENPSLPYTRLANGSDYDVNLVSPEATAIAVENFRASFKS